MELDLRVRSLLADGDVAAAATAAIESLGPPILGYLRTLHRDEDDAADVFQEWAEDVWRGIAGFRGECALRAWGYRLAWHASARFRRDGWRQRRNRLRTSVASRLAVSVVRSRPIGRRDERLEVLCRDLGPEDRTLLLLRLDCEMPWNEIAAVLADEGNNATAPALRKRFQRRRPPCPPRSKPRQFRRRRTRPRRGGTREARIEVRPGERIRWTADFLGAR